MMIKKIYRCWRRLVPSPARPNDCLVWNYRGLGNHIAVQELVKVVQAKAPSVMFLAETLADEARLDYIKDRIQFDKNFFVPRINNGGGLVLY